MLVSDLRHFLDLPDHTPAPALRLAEQLRDIVRAATARAEGAGWVSALRCRRRPGNRSCQGRLCLRRTDEQALISWQCTACHDEGRISGWQDTPYDLRGGPVESNDTAQDIVVSDNVIASLRETLLLDADCERVAYGARTLDGQTVLTATQEKLDELLGYLAAEANHEANPRRRKRVAAAYEQLNDTARRTGTLTTASRSKSDRQIGRPITGSTPTPPLGGIPELDLSRVQRWCAARPRTRSSPGPSGVRDRSTTPDDRRTPGALAGRRRAGLDQPPRRQAAVRRDLHDLDAVLAQPQPPLPPLRPATALGARRRSTPRDRPRSPTGMFWG